MVNRAADEAGDVQPSRGGRAGLPPGLGRALVLGASRSGIAAALALRDLDVEVTLSDRRELGVSTWDRGGFTRRCAARKGELLSGKSGPTQNWW